MKQNKKVSLSFLIEIAMGWRASKRGPIWKMDFWNPNANRNLKQINLLVLITHDERVREREGGQLAYLGKEQRKSESFDQWTSWAQARQDKARQGWLMQSLAWNFPSVICAQILFVRYVPGCALTPLRLNFFHFEQKHRTPLVVHCKKRKRASFKIPPDPISTGPALVSLAASCSPEKGERGGRGAEISKLLCIPSDLIEIRKKEKRKHNNRLFRLNKHKQIK